MPLFKPSRGNLRGKFRLGLVLWAALSQDVLAESLRSQMESLGKKHGFVIEGADRLEEEPARTASGDIAQKIRELLSDYNFMIVGQGDKIEKLIITSLKQPMQRPRVGGAVKTQRMGIHHQVQATISGPSGSEIPVFLLVDTGATTLVLPDSLIGRLGFSGQSLRPGVSQTAGGSIPVRLGVLKTVKVGDVLLENVQVSFVADSKLNGSQLLGMSFLNRFRFSLDDENNELLLTPR